MNENIEKLVVKLSNNPFDSALNFEIAQEYEKLNQTASAISFYLRCMEYSKIPKDPFVYASLIRLSLCFESQKDRVHTVSNAILQAIVYDHKRPEAYFFMSRFYERSGSWQECYTWAELGLLQDDADPLPANVDYHGRYCLEFEKAVSSWWIGKQDESKKLLVKLKSMDIAPEYKKAIEINLTQVGIIVI